MGAGPGFVLMSPTALLDAGGLEIWSSSVSRLLGQTGPLHRHPVGSSGQRPAPKLYKKGEEHPVTELTDELFLNFTR